MNRTETTNQIICGDCLEVLPNLPRATMIFADPPDNVGIKYNGFDDKWPSHNSYLQWLNDVIRVGAIKSMTNIFWLSYNQFWQPYVLCKVSQYGGWRQVIWRFTFGQHNSKDLGIGYRPILRILFSGAKLYPDAIREQSQRQRNNDKRANPKGRVPDDVWEFPRVCGTFKERCKWHPNQHPEALIERIIKFSTVPGDLVIDMFAGTGTVNRVCKRLGRSCIGIEISKYYCDKIAEETGAEPA